MTLTVQRIATESIGYKWAILSLPSPRLRGGLGRESRKIIKTRGDLYMDGGKAHEAPFFA